MLQARTFAEACTFIELQGVAGARIDFASHLTVERDPDTGGQESILIFQRDSDGTRHRFEFRVPATPPDAADEWRYGYGEEPSTLIDAAQWLGLEMHNAAAARSAIMGASCGTVDRHTYEFVREALSVAGAAALEQAKFLPPGANDVPAEAVWTADGEEIRQRLGQLLRRQRIESAVADYQKALEEVQRLPEAPVGSGIGAMSLPRARSSNEAQLYIELHPCLCGTTSVPATSRVTTLDEHLALAYEGSCPSCGHPRQFTFRISDNPAPRVPPNEWSTVMTPSELLDAGEWRWVADALGGDAVEHLSADEQLRAADNSAAAAAAIDEVLKFVPADGDEVPDSAFWTARGQEVRHQEPGRFLVFRLKAAREAYRQLADEHARAARSASPSVGGAAVADDRSGADVPRGAVQPAESLQPLPARSVAEATLYMALRPCECGSPALPSCTAVDAGARGDRYLYTGACETCGRDRSFLFEVPVAAQPISPDAYAPPEAPPSQLIDAGEWWLMAQVLAEVAGRAERTGPAADRSEDETREWVQSAIGGAHRAIEEVLRFLPPGAAHLDADALWTPAGLELWKRSPDEFTATRLRELSTTYATPFGTFEATPRSAK